MNSPVELKTTDLLDQVSKQRNDALNDLALATAQIFAYERIVLELRKEIALLKTKLPLEEGSSPG